MKKKIFFIEEDIGSTLLLTCNRDETRNLKFWYLDLGDSNHITGGKDIFFALLMNLLKIVFLLVIELNFQLWVEEIFLLD